jgi:alpha-N-arabinofuranosidase
MIRYKIYHVISLRIICLLSLFFIPILVNASVKNAQINIDVNNKKSNVVKDELFGVFAEFLLDNINGPNGIWAQEFMDRGFDIEDYSRINIGKVWNNWKKYPDDKVEKIWGGYNKNGRYQVRLIGKHHDSQTGVYQTVVVTDTVGYTFYLYYSGRIEIGKLMLGIFNSDNTEEIISYEIGKPSSDWQKTTIKIPRIKGKNRLNYFIYLEGIGEVDIDEASCVPDDNILGIRKEYYDLLKKMKVGIFRYPGGCFADTKGNKLEYCIGDIDQRYSPNIVYGMQYERMDFGLHEFLQLCENLGCEPKITLNFENSTPEEAANYVEYCNGDTTTTFGKLRKANGRSEPFKVKYWEIGNEQWYNTPEYLKGYVEIYDKIKEVDNSIIILIDGNHWNGRKNFDSLVYYTRDKCEIYSYHHACGVNINHNLTDYERYISLIGMPHEMDKFIVSVDKWILESGFYPKLKQGTTEWWTTYSSETKDEWLIDTNSLHSSLMMGLLNAGFMNTFIRQSETFVLASRTLGIGFIRKGYDKSGNRKIFGTLPYEALKMISNHHGKDLISFVLEVEKYTPVFREGMHWVTDVPYLDVSVTGGKDSIFLIVINRSVSDSIQTNININTQIKSAKVYQLHSGHYMDYTTADEPDKIKETEIYYKSDSYNHYVFPPHSLTIISYYCPKIDPNYKEENPNSSSIYYDEKNRRIRFNFEINKYIDYEIYIYDLLGRLIRKHYLYGYINNYSIDNDFLMNGIYLILVKNSWKSIFNTINIVN